MIIEVKVKAGSKSASVTVAGEGALTVQVKALPEQGTANKAVIKLLAKHFSVPQSKVKIKAGSSSSRKIIEIEMSEERSRT